MSNLIYVYIAIKLGDWLMFSYLLFTSTLLLISFIKSFYCNKHSITRTLSTTLSFYAHVQDPLQVGYGCMFLVVFILGLKLKEYPPFRTCYSSSRGTREIDKPPDDFQNYRSDMP